MGPGGPCFGPFVFGPLGLALYWALYHQYIVEVMHVRDSAMSRTDLNAQLAVQLGKLGKAVKKDRRRSSTGRISSASDTSDVNDFDATACLTRYGFPSLSHSHCPAYSDLKALVKAARHAKKKGRAFVVHGSLHKFAPQWMPQKFRPRSISEMTHAQWTACWWARAFSQLSAQAATSSEAVSVDTLVSQFLDANRVALEDTGKVAMEYDAQVWESTAERCRRHDSSCNPSAIMSTVDEHVRARARSRLPGAFDKAALAPQASSQNRSNDSYSRQPRYQGGSRSFNAYPPRPPKPPPPQAHGHWGAGRR